MSRLVLLVAIGASLASALLVPLSAAASGPTKTTICHRTSSHTNPYRRITVAQSALVRAHGHGDHLGPVWDPAGPKGWGDIVPGADAGGDPDHERNWPQGRGVWDGTAKAGRRAACGYLSAAAFVAGERAERVPAATIVADLNSQSANEDIALLSALSINRFTEASLDMLDAVSATTSPVVDGELTRTTAVLRGTVTSGTTEAVRSFVHGTDPYLLTGSSAAAGQGTGQAAVSATITGLEPGTTYYYKTVGTTGGGTDFEGVLEGEVLSFTTPEQDPPVAKRSQTITFAQPADMVVGTPATLDPTASSDLTVTLSASEASACTAEGFVVRPTRVGACVLTATQEGDGQFEAASPVSWSVPVTAATTRSGQSITFAQPAAMVVGTPVTLSPTASSGLPVTLTPADPAVCSVTDSVTGSVVRPLRAGDCGLSATQGGDSTWTAAAAVVRTVAVVAPQTITFGQPARLQIGTAVTVEPSSTSGLPVALHSSDPAVCSVSRLVVTAVTAGTCTLTASQSGDRSWAPAPDVDRTVSVVAPQTITFGRPADVALPVGAVTLEASASSRLPVTFSVTGGAAACSVLGTRVVLRTAGACTVTAAQAGNDAWLPAPPVTRTFTITVPDPPTPSPSATPTPTTSPVPSVPVPAVERLAGRERTETSARLALSMYPEPRTARVVVLARSDVYADGLTGSPLAGTLDGPVLLTAPDRLPDTTARALRSVLAPDGTVVVLGGTRAVTPAVVAQVTRLGYRSERIGGVDRYATATLIADRIEATTSVSQVYLATGTNFPDALSAASAAEVTGGVVLLTRGAAMPGVTRGWLTEHASTGATAVGGAAATAAPQVERIVGRDRYTTAALVAEAVLPEADGVVMVTGTDFPDGLAGASYAARNEWPMLLVDPRATALTPGQDAYLGRISGRVEDLVAIGGSEALPPAATALVSRRLDRAPAS